MDLRRDMETRGRASIGEKRAKGKDENAESRPRNKGQPKGGQETAGGRGGEGGGGATRGRPSERKGVVAADEGVVPGGSKKRSAARSSYA